jgi:hypothetical protein
VKGVGRFTADGLLLLGLRRPDVWPPTWSFNAPSSGRSVKSTRSNTRGAAKIESRHRKSSRAVRHLTKP